MEKNILHKKIYSKPILEVIAVDHEISLVMDSMLIPDNPGGGVDPLGAKQRSTNGPLQIYSTSEDMDPFGGGIQY